MTPAPRVADRVEGVRRHATRRVWRAAVPWAFTALGLVLLLAWILAGPDGWAQGTSAPLLLDLGLVTLGIAGALVLRRVIARTLTDASVSGEMDAAAGLPDGSVLGSLELGRVLPAGVSEQLAAAAERDVIRGLDLPEERLAGRVGREAGRWARRGWATLAVMVPAVVLLVVVAPSRSVAAWSGLGSPVSLLSSPALPPVTVTPGDADVERGADVEIVVSAPLRDSVTVRWRSAGDVPRSVTLPVRDGRATTTVEDVRAATRYGVVTPDGAEAGDFTLTPVDPLFVTDVEVELAFPAYMGRSPETYEGDLPPLTVPGGTRISVVGRASRELSTVALTDSAGEAVASFEVEGTDFHGRWLPRTGGTFDWHFIGADGEPPATPPLPLQLTVVPDSPPEVRFAFPARDTVLPASLRQPLVLEARDDHGLRTLELVAWRVTALGAADEARVQGMQVEGSRAVEARPLMDVSGWGLLPGDTVRYYARVRDHAPGGAEVRTPEYVLEMPGIAAMRRGAEERLDETARGLEGIAERAARSEEETRALERRAAAENARSDTRRTALRSRPEPGRERVGFEEREAVRRAVEEQAAMEAEVDSLRGSLAEMSEAMADAGLSDPSLRRDLDELQGLMEEMSSPEQRERLERMTEALDEMGGEEARRAMEELLEQQEAFRERLEESLDRFRRAAVDQDFRATTAETEELARQEEALAEGFREEDDPLGRAEQQDELERRAAEAEARMERLEGRLQQLGEQDAAREVREAVERSSESRDRMREAAASARRDDGGEAGERADGAAESMDEAARELREAQQRMAREQAAAIEGALRQAADDALSLARRQSELRQEMRGAGGERMAEMRGDVAAVERGVRNMADNLATTDGAQAGGRELSEAMGRAMEAVRGTAEAMDGGVGPTPSPERRAGEAVDALNQVALMAMAGARMMSQGGEAQGQAGGEGEVQQELQELAQQQGRLNNQAGQMMPLQLGPGALRSLLQELSRDQQSVAEELDELAQRPGSREEALGDLEAMAQEARALAEELAGGRMEPETRRRQERLFHRLLDSGRSLEKDELSDERESEAAGAYGRGEVLPLGPEALRALRYRLPEAGVMERLTPAQRRLVIRYFERLNRGGGDGEDDQGGEGGGGGS